MGRQARRRAARKPSWVDLQQPARRLVVACDPDIAIDLVINTFTGCGFRLKPTPEGGDSGTGPLRRRCAILRIGGAMGWVFEQMSDAESSLTPIVIGNLIPARPKTVEPATVVAAAQGLDPTTTEIYLAQQSESDSLRVANAAKLTTRAIETTITAFHSRGWLIHASAPLRHYDIPDDCPASILGYPRLLAFGRTGKRN